MTLRIKGKLYLLVFVLTAGILAWGVWFNYRPQVIYAGCMDIADRAFSVRKRVEKIDDPTFEYDKTLNNCLQDAGYYEKK
jgi:hypothetical protein